MILVVCLNPALDVTHHVPTVDWAGATAGPAIVKPNLAELEALAGRQLSTAHGAGEFSHADYTSALATVAVHRDEVR